MYISIALSTVLSTVVFFLLRNVRKNEYFRKSEKVFLEGFREAFENKMYGINEKLVLNEERWRDVNHLLIQDRYNDELANIGMSKNVKMSEFLEVNGIKRCDLIIDEKLVFILTPFNETFYNDYLTIKEACMRVGYRAVRGDEVFFKSDIFTEMLKLIVKSNLIIANINGRNPNVMYELGIAHALDKQVLLISKSPKELPIDIKSKRFLIYQNHEELGKIIRAQLMEL